LPALNSFESPCISKNADLSSGPAQVLDAEMSFVVGDVEEANRMQKTEETEARAIFEEARSLLQTGKQICHTFNKILILLFALVTYKIGCHNQGR
jgi:hypothetical protein